MPPSTERARPVGAADVRFDEPDLRSLQIEVSMEFREMPGLTLTLAQAARLFGTDVARCERVLGALVARGVLATNGRAFARADAGWV